MQCACAILPSVACPALPYFSTLSHKRHDFREKKKSLNTKCVLLFSTNLFAILFFFLWRCGLTRAMTSSFLRFLDHTKRRTTVSRTPLEEWSARRRDLYLTTHNTQHRQTSMPPVGFEPTISAGERPQTYALDRAATGTGLFAIQINKYTIY